jgi:hypothetical protein
MPVVALQERLKALALGMDRGIPNENFRILAADSVDGGINLAPRKGSARLSRCSTVSIF